MKNPKKKPPLSSPGSLRATRRLPVVHLGRLGFSLSPRRVRPDIFSDPDPLRRCSWNSPYSCGLRIWPSDPGYRRFKTSISPAPPTPSWVQAGRPTTCYHTTLYCTQHLVAFGRDPTKHPAIAPPLIIAEHRSKACSPAAPPCSASTTSTTGTHCRAH